MPAGRSSAVTGPVAPATEQGPEPEQPRRAVRGIGRAALLIAGLTVLARMLGLARTLVFAGTVKTSCLGAAYVTANQVPTVVYDIVLGGALTASWCRYWRARRSGQARPTRSGARLRPTGSPPRC